MPYFFKVRDSKEYKNWFDKVIYVIVDFINTCKGDIIILPYNINKNDIHKHITIGIDENDHEYFTSNTIPKENMIDYYITFGTRDIKNQDDLKSRSKIKLIHFIDSIYNINNNIYIHITCAKYYNSIFNNGLIDINNVEEQQQKQIRLERVGDKDDDEIEARQQQQQREYMGRALDMYDGGRKNNLTKRKYKKSNKSKQRKSNKSKQRKYNLTNKTKRNLTKRKHKKSKQRK